RARGRSARRRMHGEGSWAPKFLQKSRAAKTSRRGSRKYNRCKPVTQRTGRVFPCRIAAAPGRAESEPVPSQESGPPSGAEATPDEKIAAAAKPDLAPETPPDAREEPAAEPEPEAEVRKIPRGTFAVGGFAALALCLPLMTLCFQA